MSGDIMPKITVDTAELQMMIKDSVKESLAEIGTLPSCAIEKARMNVIESRLDKALIVLVGNGDPEHGLVYKFGLIEKDVKRITAGVWAFSLAVIGLFITTMWNTILASK